MSHPLFEQLPAINLTTENFDAQVFGQSNDPSTPAEQRIHAVFFWGIDCPNCEVAKRLLLQDLEQVQALDFKWFESSVYEHPELGVRFGLHGIPAFFFFKGEKKLGRISPFPGMTPFMTALHELKGKVLKPG
ncbi:MAG: thioredoxin [Proteobacteria bacterium]|nr:MAG: thioredoxin [Pseudomonadota bacterium]